MCVIVYSPPKASVPTKKVLKICWENNDDGAGFGYSKVGDKIMHIEKGFMKFKKFWRAFNKHQFTKDDEVVIHFRIGTSGGNTDGNTHPFPITDSIQEMKQTEFSSDLVFAHNGIVGYGEHGISDTMVFNRDVLFKLKKYMHDPHVIDAIEGSTIDSRLFIFRRGSIFLTGEWIHDKKTGIWYSNESYKKKKKSKVVYYNSKNSGVVYYIKDCPICMDAKYTYFKDEIGLYICANCEIAFNSVDDIIDLEEVYEEDKDNQELVEVKDYIDSSPVCPICDKDNDVLSESDGTFSCWNCDINFEIDGSIISPKADYSTTEDQTCPSCGCDEVQTSYVLGSIYQCDKCGYRWN